MPTPRFHGTLTPSSTRADVLVLDVDSAPFPPDSSRLEGVDVHVWERDQSSNRLKLIGGNPDGSEIRTKDDYCGTFTLDLRQNSANGRIEIASVAFDQEKRFEQVNKLDDFMGAVTVVVRGHADVEHRILVGMQDEEWHKDIPPWRDAHLEMGLSFELGTSETPIEELVRNTQFRTQVLSSHVVPQGTVATALIESPAPDDRNNFRYYAGARDYWEPRSDLVRQGDRPADAGRDDPGPLVMLEDIHESVVNPPGSGATSEWKIEELNIVSHGDFEYWSVATRSDGDVFMSARDVENFTKDFLGTSTPARPARLLDQSRVVIRGCSLGRDPHMMKAISRLFGGVTVFAPNGHYNVYLRLGPDQAPRELLYERFFLQLNKLQDLERHPRQARRLLEEKFPDVDFGPMFQTRLGDVLRNGRFADAMWDTDVFGDLSIDCEHAASGLPSNQFVAPNDDQRKAKMLQILFKPGNAGVRDALLIPRTMTLGSFTSVTDLRPTNASEQTARATSLASLRSELAASAVLTHLEDRWVVREERMRERGDADSLTTTWTTRFLMTYVEGTRALRENPEDRGSRLMTPDIDNPQHFVRFDP